jgi:hypothetical protein
MHAARSATLLAQSSEVKPPFPRTFCWKILGSILAGGNLAQSVLDHHPALPMLTLPEVMILICLWVTPAGILRQTALDNNRQGCLS